jgi:hypothetical protein
MFNGKKERKKKCSEFRLGLSKSLLKMGASDGICCRLNEFCWFE